MLRKNLFKIIALNLLGIGLFLSWFLTMENGFWYTIDREVFFFFNHLVGESSFFLYLVAFVNFRHFDAVAFLFMLLIFLHYYRKMNPEGKRFMFCMGVAMLVSVIFVKLADGCLDINRLSASNYFALQGEPVNFVKDMTGWNVKDRSATSFPGDHGMMLLIFTSFMLRYFGKKPFEACTAVFLLFSLPRIMSGAHWVTDILVGSLSIVLVVMSWILLTPASDRFIAWLEPKIPLRFFIRRRH